VSALQTSLNVLTSTSDKLAFLGTKIVEVDSDLAKARVILESMPFPDAYQEELNKPLESAKKITTSDKTSYSILSEWVNVYQNEMKTHLAEYTVYYNQLQELIKQLTTSVDKLRKERDEAYEKHYTIS